MLWKISGDVFHGVENPARLRRANGGEMIYKRPTPRRRVFMGKGGMYNKRQAPCGPWITRSFEQVGAGYSPQVASPQTPDVR